MNIDLIRVPIFYGCDRKGAELGPNAIFNNNIMNVFQKYGNNINDAGCVNVCDVSEKDKHHDHPKMKYLGPIVDANVELASMVSNSIKNGRVPLTLGGDHCIGLGTLAGVSDANKGETAVIWIDAHADINTVETSPSGNIHGMPLGASIGVGDKSLTDLYIKKRKVNPNNVFLVGLRDVDDGEVEIIDDYELNAWYMEEIKDKGMGIVILEILDMMKKKNIENIHISYDIDSLDMTLVPGTGTPVSDGMFPDESKKLIKALFRTGLVRSVDFVEYNPEKDKNNITKNTVMDMLETFAQEMGKAGIEQNLNKVAI